MEFTLEEEAIALIVPFRELVLVLGAQERQRAVCVLWSEMVNAIFSLREMWRQSLSFRDSGRSRRSQLFVLCNIYNANVGH